MGLSFPELLKTGFPPRSTLEPTRNIDLRSEEKIPSLLRLDPDVVFRSEVEGGSRVGMGDDGGGSCAAVWEASENSISQSSSSSSTRPCCIPSSIVGTLEQLCPIVPGSSGCSIDVLLMKSRVSSLQIFSVSIGSCYRSQFGCCRSLGYTVFC